jgi:hypothetical protein
MTGTFSRRGIVAQQAMCGSVRYRDAETTVPACHLSRSFLRIHFTSSTKLARKNDQ